MLWIIKYLFILPRELKTKLLEEVDEFSNSIEDEFKKIMLLINLASYLSGTRKEQVIEKALHTIKSSPGDYYQLWFLSRIALLLPLEKSLEMIESLCDETYQVQALLELLYKNNIPNGRIESIKANIYKLTKLINNKENKSQFLAELSNFYPQPKRTELLMRPFQSYKQYLMRAIVFELLQKYFRVFQIT